METKDTSESAMSIDNQNVLVTDGTGFDNHLLDLLMDIECDVIIVNDLSAGCLENTNR